MRQDWDYKKPVIEDNWEPARTNQLAYIQKLQHDLGKPSNVNQLMLSRKEAAALIHDLHLEWLRSRGDAE